MNQYTFYRMSQDEISMTNLKTNDGRYKTYLKITHDNKDKEKAVAYFKDPLGFYFFK